jgi:LuxR family transcriptional regulator, maltose regulon positive regulatory protein
MSVATWSTPPVTISRSKVERPVLAGHWVRRPQIEARLDRVLTRSLVVVTAPAGHGKTSTIASWLRLRNHDAAWVTLDRRDTNLTQFAVHVAVALEYVSPGIEANLLRLLVAPDRMAPHDLGVAFGETLYDLERDAILVLDDVHMADADAVAIFVEGLVLAAPRRLHTILICRGKPPIPLSRLRTAGAVEELTGADLRFSAQETSELLRLETREVIDPDMAERLQASVGGWPAAIRLLAFSRGADTGSRSLEQAGAPHEHVLRDYLGEEVLAQLPYHQRLLLLRASLLDRFNVPLLEAIATVYGGERISRADLEHLRALELYREIPGLSETWFAFHALFRDILSEELARTAEPGAVSALHRHIAEWFVMAGLTRDAVHHFVAAGDLPAAAALIESRLSEAFAREDWQSVASWLREIPAEEIRGRVEVLLASAWVAYLSGRDAGTAEVLEAMRDPRFRHSISDAQRAEMALLADWPDDDPNASVKTAEDAIARIPSSKRYQYGYAHLALGMALTSAGREDEALARLAAFTDRESGHIDAASIRGYFGRVVVLWQAGRLARCQQTAADLLQLAQVNNLPLSAGWGAAFLGFVAHERGELAQATRQFETVFAGAEKFHFVCIRDVFFAQILAFQAQGLHDEVDRAAARMRELVIAAETPQHLEMVDSVVARIALIRGDLATARGWLETSSARPGRDALKSIEHPLLTRVKVLVAVGTHDTLAEADHLLSTFLSAARATHMTLALLEGLAVQAVLYEATGDHAASTRALRESLSLAAPEGIVQRYAYLGPALAPLLRRLVAGPAADPHARSVLGALEALLAAQPAATRASADLHRGLPENPLTDRELEVVHLLAQRLTNNEIGEELFISPITVKNHIANITEKLGVSGRRAAVERSGELGLFRTVS